MATNKVNIEILAQDKASKKIGVITKAFGGLGGVLKGAAIGATAAGVAIGAATIKLAKDAIPVEGITKAFKGLTKEFKGGSEAMLKSLKRASLGMVSNTKLMEKFNLASNLVSQDFAEKLPDAMGYLSKVAAATGQDMDYMMDSMVRGVGRLSPMILDNLAIQVDATQAYEDFAKANGLVASELTKTQQQTALMNQVMTKLKENTADMPEVAGTAAQQFAALGVTFDNLKSEIGLKLLPMFTAIAETLTAALEDPAIQAGIDNLITWIGNVIGDENSGIVGVITAVASGEIERGFDMAFGKGAYGSVMKTVGAIDDLYNSWNKFYSWFVTTNNDLTRWIHGAQDLTHKIMGLVGITTQRPRYPLMQVPGSYRGPRAEGGPVSGGSSYLVGERGPELFTPGTSGNITPNNVALIKEIRGLRADLKAMGAGASAFDIATAMRDELQQVMG